MRTFLGVDGCRYGWVCALLNEKKEMEASLYTSFSEVLESHPAADRVFIDMPIGLTGHGVFREVEPLARKLLKPYRTSSIFTPPCWEALAHTAIAPAREANIKVTGKSFSAQAWNISPKIKEVCEVLVRQVDWRERVFEAHPEICFAQFNGGQPLAKAKNTPQGLAQRVALLGQVHPPFQAVYEKALAGHPRKQVKPDDLLDAICLAFHAFFSKKFPLVCLEGGAKRDFYGLPMRICHTEVGDAARIL